MSTRSLVVLLLLSGLLACGGPKHAPIPPGATVLVLGDSISFGTGAEKGQDYPTLLAGNTGWNIINAGVPGDTTTDGLERLPALLEEHNPKFVVVELGGNDFLNHQPLTQTETNLKGILGTIKARGIPVVMLAVPTPDLMGAAFGNLSDAPLFERVGKETDTPVIPHVLAHVLTKNALKSDQIHPNAAGYRQVEVELREALKDRGFLQ